MLFTALGIVASIPWLYVLSAPAPTHDAAQALQTQETAQSHARCKSLTPRREWRSLEPEDRAAWISAVKCLANQRYRRLTSHKSSSEYSPEDHSLYDEFAYTHNKMHDTAHTIEYFLPWHRWFLNLFDKKLRSTCGYSGPTPYWDWTLDAADPFHAPVFDGNPVTGLGSTGECKMSDCHIVDGALAPSPDSQFILAYPIPHPLRRNMTLHLYGDTSTPPLNETFTPERVESIIDTSPGDFYTFQSAIQRSHNSVHQLVGGDLNEQCPSAIPAEACLVSYTSNDPLFWLHHAQMDRLWSVWQRRHPANFNAFSGMPLNITWEDYEQLGDNIWRNKGNYDLHASSSFVMNYDAMSKGVPVSDVFNHEIGELCYEYQ